MSPDLIKRARLAIEGLRDENQSLKEEKEDLTEKLAHLKKAQDLAFNLLESGAIVAEDLEEKIAELSEKSEEELHVFEKAAELANDPSYQFNLGSISERPQDDGSLDPLTSMLINDL